MPAEVENDKAPKFEQEPPMIEGVSVPDTNRPYRPRFRPREYWGLSALQIVYYVLASVCLGGFLIGEVVCIIGAVSAAEARQPRVERRTVIPAGADVKEELDRIRAERAAESLQPAMLAAGATLMVLAWQVFLITCLGLPGIFFVAAGQLIGLMVDVQANTEESAHHLRYLAR